MNPIRTRNKYKATSYPLTQNSYEEQDRMVAQHYLLRTAFHEKDYMASGMASSLKQGCIVLDMGCSTGTWTMELATAYPNSHFIGLDQLALFPRDIKPKNCHFATCDLTCLPLPIPDASVDYIFQRDMNWALMASQWPLLIKEYLRILKPGGWIELMEMDIESQSSQRQERLFNDKLIYGLSMRQQDPYVARQLPSILAINGFRRVSSQFQSLPLGWGKAHQHQKETKSKSTTNNNHAHPLLSLTSSSVSVSSTSSSSSSSSTTCSEYARAAASQYKFMLQSLCPWLSTVMGCSTDKYMVAVDQLESEWSQAHTYIKWHSAVAQKPLH
ncbi:S-adenosyl-L-methionine-dependent methyltransferase [Absidia repens]|uniref:S-adenosyl-L-methionine-dependent methyltransferase n=1 Tax=Absidia repens TaxID=90262 RepID=A0A1X2IAU1_9FUNG|nr:S-adenosyl-L-methionine-dependent methyltransferase [Absidia repens]